MCSVSVVTTKLVSTAIDDRVDYLSKVRGKEESVYDKVVRQFRELEKNADKYFDNLDAVEEMCHQAKKDAQRFRLKAEADKELLKRDAAVRAKLYSSVTEMKEKLNRMDIKEEPTCPIEEKMPEAAENAHRLTVTGRVSRYVRIGCALVFDAVAVYTLFRFTHPYFFKSLRRALKRRWAHRSALDVKRNIDDRFINLVRVSRKNSYSNLSKSQWVWSEVFSWKNEPWAESRCKKWHQKEPNPDTFRGNEVYVLKSEFKR
ncbi:hypothetical protein pdam_00017286 [Pocillopora damicornis]|uniref:Uncharacterized protein n=1 Tax=Pocillopora damicornis TaxID=46731 RepID=A0A3M6U8H2_POCDA|nr:hypothetical protein pdam_00017286 [Pocillopora damicornis]